MKFKLDENIPTDLVSLLNSEGHDAVSVLDQQMGREEDRKLAAVCASEKRILLTFDIDFANLRSYPPEKYGGFLVFRLQRQDKPNLFTAVKKLLFVLERESPVGQLWVVEEDRIRIRT